MSQLAPAPKPVPQPIPQPTPTIPSVAPTPPVPTPPAQPASGPAMQPNLQSLLNSSTLADLLKVTANRQRPTPPPQPQQTFPTTQTSTAQAAPPAAAAVTPENPLIASLRARGLLPPPPTAPAAPEPPNFPFILPGQAGFNPAAATQPNAAAATKVQMTSASIRMYVFCSLKDDRIGTC